jgi:poly-gamma-glutamate synthesis protein (capsule biosynthesis protein)
VTKRVLPRCRGSGWRTSAAVRAARAAADVVVFYVHWGEEGNECPVAEMTELA